MSPLPIKSKVVDFSGVDVYPDKYHAKKTKDGFAFRIRSVVIEHVDIQEQHLVNLGKQLLLGDYIRVSTTFGHYAGRPGEPEDPQKWVSIPLVAELKLQQIIPQQGNNQIRLLVRPYHFRA